MSSAVLVLLLAVGAVATLAAQGSGGGKPTPMIKGTVKWFNDAIIVPINNLLSGTGITLDRYEGPRLDGIGIRIEPPLGVMVTDNNSPPKHATAGGKMPRPTATKKIVGVFETTVAFAAEPGAEPWATMTASNAGAAEGIPHDKTDGLGGRGGFVWGMRLRSLPPGGLLVQFSSEYYQLTADGSGVVHLEEVSLTTVPPVPGGPGVLNRRPFDHIGNFNCIEVAGQLLAGWPPQQATKKIVGWRSGIELDADVEWEAAAAGDRRPVIVMDITIEPAHIAKATPWKHHDINFAGKKVDFVATRDGEPLATMDCPEPEAGAAPAPYVLELSDQGGSLPIYDAATGNGCLLTWQPATATSPASVSLDLLP
jgi:hypothetical protein